MAELTAIGLFEYLSTSLGYPVYPVYAPMDSARPLIVYQQRQRETFTYTIDGYLNPAPSYWDVACWADGYRQAKQMAQQVGELALGYKDQQIVEIFYRGQGDIVPDLQAGAIYGVNCVLEIFSREIR